MSGIAGIFHFDGRPVDPRLLEAMSATLAHRGPDGAALWSDGSVGLAHRMLHATPESLRETQPLSDESSQLVLVLDGRIDNREELRAAIESAGGHLRDDTDAELVLKSYECWAEDSPKHLLGDFAFAIWDARRRRLFCARDPLGNKPFFYRCDHNTFAFASEMQPLFVDPEFPCQLNLPLVGMYLSDYFSEPEDTLYLGVSRLRAAHSMKVESGAAHKARYWDVDPERSIRYRTDDEYAEHYLDLFRQSVRDRVRAHGALGFTLSGGLDSSSVVCTASKLFGESGARDSRLTAFSLIYAGLPCDESKYIQEVIRHTGVEHWPVLPQADPSQADLERSPSYPDVFYDPFQFSFSPALREMQHRGQRVLLSGFGSDETLNASYAMLTQLARQGDIRAMFRYLRSFSAIYAVPQSTLLLQNCVYPFIPKPVKNLLRPLVKPFRRKTFPSLLRPDFLASSGMEDRMRRGVKVTRLPSASQQELYNGLLYGWNALAIEMHGLFCARFGVECRHPFLERRLVEFTLALPEEQRWRGEGSKFVLRQAMRGILPEAIRTRKGKAEFSAPLDWELRVRQRAQVEELFRNSVMTGLGITDRGRLLGLLGQYRNGNRHLLNPVVNAVGLELACRFALKTEKGD